LDSGKHWFDVNDRTTVDGLHRPNPQTVVGDFAHGDVMKAKRIWSVRRARCKDTSKGAATVRTGMNFQHVTKSQVKPTYNDDVVAYP
jgi:hypothetical protein